MKTSHLFLLMLLGLGTVSAQQADTIPRYKKDNRIPEFNLLQTDSTWFTNKQLPKSAFTIIVYFSPTCGHCQFEAKEMVKNMDSLEKVFFVWASYNSLNEIKDFYHEYGLDKFRNIRIGRDPSYGIPSFFQVRQTPLVALYNKNGRLVKVFDAGVIASALPELLALMRQNS